MSTQNLLNYQYIPAPKSSQLPLVFIHGLFGDMNNLGIIARAFNEHFPILRVDLRNHGKSFHSDEMNYDLMAQDMLALLSHLGLNKVILIGHSMGGKTAMKVASLAPNLVDKLIIIDISPIKYANHHDSIFQGLFAVKNAQVNTRQQAKPLLAQYIEEEAIQQFMLKSFDATSQEKFCFNLTALYHNYAHLMDWSESLFNKPTLFIKGGLSDYILPEHSKTILTQFPQARSFIIASASHWVHAEKPQNVIRAIQKFLTYG